MKKAPLARQERDLLRAEKLIELYERLSYTTSMYLSARMRDCFPPPCLQKNAGCSRLIPNPLTGGITGSISYPSTAPLVLSAHGKGGRWSLVRLGS